MNTTPLAKPYMRHLPTDAHRQINSMRAFGRRAQRLASEYSLRSLPELLCALQPSLRSDILTVFNSASLRLYSDDSRKGDEGSSASDIVKHKAQLTSVRFLYLCAERLVDV